MGNRNWIGDFEYYVEEMMKESRLPGVAVGMAKEGEVFYEKGFGYRDIENQLEVTNNTVFAVGSITKSITCVALMQLQEEGKLFLHDPIKKYLPDFHLKNEKHYIEQMTVHHFMTHTSGIPDLKSFPVTLYESLTDEDFKYDPLIRGNKKELEPIHTYEEYLDYLSHLDFELLSTPGTQWHYNNDCYGLLGLIIERVSRQGYEEYIHEHILKPSDMNHTSFFLENLPQKDVTKLYVQREKNGQPIVVLSPNWWDTSVQRAAGFLKSTVSDMLKYTEIFRTGGNVGAAQILTKDSVNQMAKVHFWNNSLLGEGYGYGLSVVPNYHGHKLVEKAGGIKGGGAQMYIIPDKELTGIVLTNMSSVIPTVIMNGAFNSLEDRPLDVSHVNDSSRLEKEDLLQYIGSYQSDSMNWSLSVELKEDQLQVCVIGSFIALKPIDKDAFLLGGTMDFIKFNRDEKDRIIGIDYKGLKFMRKK